MTASDDFFPGVKCHMSQSDVIPVSSYCTDPLNFGGTINLICDSNHLLSYIKNPRSLELNEKDFIQYYHKLEIDHPIFLQMSDDDTFQMFEDIINSRVIESWRLTSFALRVFTENLIYHNYGVYAWFGDVKLNRKTDCASINTINENIRDLGFSTFMIIIISKSKRDDIINPKNRGKIPLNLDGRRLELAKNASENLNIVLKKKNILSYNSLNYIQTLYREVSPVVHTNRTPDSSTIDNYIKKMMDIYEEFYTNGNEWGISYD